MFALGKYGWLHYISFYRIGSIPKFYTLFGIKSYIFITFAAEMDRKLNKRRRKYIGILLQRERKSLRIDQEEIAQVLGVRQEQISKIESGDRRIDVVELIVYCEALGLSPKEFAAKIETRLFSEGVLKRSRTLLQREPHIVEKVRVDVSWFEKAYSASFGENVPFKIEFTAYTFPELQERAKVCLDFLVKIKNADGDSDDLPQWLHNNEYELQYKFQDARSLLTAYGQYLSLAAISRVSGINQNLLSLYANGKKKSSAHQLERIVGAINKIGKELMEVVP